MEDYVSRFLYTLQKNPHHTLSEDSQKLVFLRGVNDNCLEALDLMASNDYINLPRMTSRKLVKNIQVQL